MIIKKNRIMEATPHALEELKKSLKTEENPMTGVRTFTQQGCCGPALQSRCYTRLWNQRI